VQKRCAQGGSIGLAPDLPLAAREQRRRQDEDTSGPATLAASFARAGFDGESALTAWADRFKDRFARMEALALAEHVDLVHADAAIVRQLWDRALRV
jgi:hypothetical protein